MFFEFRDPIKHFELAPPELDRSVMAYEQSFKTSLIYQKKLSMQLKKILILLMEKLYIPGVFSRFNE